MSHALSSSPIVSTLRNPETWSRELRQGLRSFFVFVSSRCRMSTATISELKDQFEDTAWTYRASWACTPQSFSSLRIPMGCLDASLARLLLITEPLPVFECWCQSFRIRVVPLRSNYVPPIMTSFSGPEHFNIILNK